MPSSPEVRGNWFDGTHGIRCGSYACSTNTPNRVEGRSMTNRLQRCLLSLAAALALTACGVANWPKAVYAGPPGTLRKTKNISVTTNQIVNSSKNTFFPTYLSIAFLLWEAKIAHRRSDRRRSIGIVLNEPRPDKGRELTPLPHLTMSVL